MPRHRNTTYEARYRMSFGMWLLLSLWWLLAPGILGGMVYIGLAGDGVPADPVDAVIFWAVAAVLLGTVVLFLGSALAYTIAIAGNRFALRLDRDGITLGGLPFPGQRRITVPWLDLDAVVLFTRAGYQGARRPFFGLRLRPGAVRPRGIPQPGSLRARLNRQPTEVSRQVLGWDLDPLALADALSHFAPHAPVIEKP